MKIARTTARPLLSAALLALCLGGSSAAPQSRDAYGNPVGNQPSGEDAGAIRQTVARISDFDGKVSYARGDDPDDWQPADRNVPVTLGDRLYADEQSRLELQVHGGNYVRLGSHTDLAVLNLTDDTKQFALKGGIASFQVRRLDSNDVFEVDTPNAAVTFQRPGAYRIDIDGEGNTLVTVREGTADVAAGGGSVSVGNSEALQIWGTDSPQYSEVAPLPRDGWDQWVDTRQAQIRQSASYRHVSSEIVGADDLDRHGRWESIPSYGSVWTPTVVAAGWAPYRIGQWIWQDPWGWTWLSTEPWGWAPYHYGRWVSWSSRWYWVPVGPRVAVVPYRPALVAFVGGGPGWSVSVSSGGYVGWFPLAPHEPFIPWWGRRHVSVTNVVYVNRNYCTVVNRTAFVSGGLVTANYVRETSIVRQVAAAPVLRGPLPCVPTREATRFAAAPTVAVVRPPAAMVDRSVVARVAPPPAAPSFQQKISVIREGGGTPVSPAVAAQISTRDRSRPEAVTAVRPVAVESGRVTLAPRQQTSTAPSAKRVEPVAPNRGRPMSTVQQPVAAAPVAAPPPETSRVRPAESSRQTRPSTQPNAPAAAQPARPNRQPAEAVPARPSSSAGQPSTRSSTGRPAPTAPVPGHPTPREREAPTNRGRSQAIPPQAHPTPAAPKPAASSAPDRSRERSSAAAHPTGSPARPAEHKDTTRQHKPEPTKKPESR
ncbi:MAG TPA: DUF6600 domain-containing protein [Thermoanaerobaculia bacterium]|nr:DUF6600 domain-containing protein [Thermoanaerobaculia bacterium]